MMLDKRCGDGITSCMDKRNMVAMVAWLAAVDGLARFFCRFVSARERNDWAFGSGEFCHVPMCEEEIYR